MQKEQEEEQKESFDSFMCPSFSTYSSNNLALLADQVSRHHLASQNDNVFDLNDHDNFEFFAFSKQEPSHDASFHRYNAPVFPIFNRHFVTESDTTGGRNSGVCVDSPALQFSLKQLLISDEDIRRESPSSSSSEVDELDGIPAGTYCAWTPKSVQSVQASPNRCKKSNSTGSTSASASKRWKLLDLLRRSNSEGKRTFAFLKKKEEVKSESSKERRRDSRNYNEIAGKKVSGDGERKLPVAVSAHEALFARNRESRTVNNNSYKRRTTYKREEYLIGMGRAFSPF
ncbi:hypothetical protein RIF29_18732 [Crotalaria pallida]|uniref:Uncharacterized protein n=1 Tax=Crotalaria pallida TaxID=3830 RepID=A0AAN9I4V7_CROPI